MKKQNYQNHVQYYAPHHFVFLPLVTILMIVGIVKGFTDEPHQLEWLLFAVVCGCILFLAVMLRQHYALGNQDRIVRLEFRLRYLELFGKSAEKIESSLSFGQIAALRFASDDEFASLLSAAVENNLSAKEIKKAIRNWKPDYMRL